MAHAKSIILTAGGTGGHLFPALATARILQKKGHEVAILSDERATSFYHEDDIPLHTVKSATPSGGGVSQKIDKALTIFSGILQARKYLKAHKPDAIIGFGGYPTVPPVIAAASLSIPIVLHDQNMIIGRANKFLLRFASAIAVVHERVRGIPQEYRHKIQVTGNPLREVVLENASEPYPNLTKECPIHILIFGGSQGARILSDIVPLSLQALPAFIRERLNIIQQARAEDLERVKAQYEQAGIKAQIETFFSDLPQKIASSHLIIARSGATTVSEVAAIGRPSILVPLAASLDGDQAENARLLSQREAAWVIEEKFFTETKLSTLILDLIFSPHRLEEAAQQAKSLAITNGTTRLAELVLKYAH